MGLWGILFQLALAQQVAFEVIKIQPVDGTNIVTFLADRNDNYYILRSSTNITELAQLGAAEGVGFASVGTNHFLTVPAGDKLRFFAIERVPSDTPLDLDSDGIDDVYELNRPHFLDPLDARDGPRDQDADGFTNREEYDLASDPEDPLSPNINPLVIDSISPFHGEEMVSVTRPAVIRFRQAMQPITVTTNTFYLLANSKRISGRVVLSTTGLIAHFYPDTPLPPSTEVRIYIEGDLISTTSGVELDFTGDGEIGGQIVTYFRTLPLTRIPGTTVFGFVKDSDTQQPLANVTIRVDAFPEANVTTDANGRFELTDMPAPDFFVHIDGSTALAPAGFTYPNVGKPFHSIPGTTSQVSMAGVPFDIYLPVAKLSDYTPLSASQATIVPFGENAKSRLAAMRPEFDPSLWDEMAVTIEASAAVDSFGNAASQATVIPVEPSRLPGPLPLGIAPNLVVSIQAPGARTFDQPASATFPNTEGFLPGEVVALTSFNHDAGRWEIVGTATVSQDGRTVQTDSGAGVIAPGWHALARLSQIVAFTWDCVGDEISDGVRGFLASTIKARALLTTAGGLRQFYRNPLGAETGIQARQLGRIMIGETLADGFTSQSTLVPFSDYLVSHGVAKFTQRFPSRLSVFPQVQEYSSRLSEAALDTFETWKETANAFEQASVKMDECVENELDNRDLAKAIDALRAREAELLRQIHQGAAGDRESAGGILRERLEDFGAGHNAQLELIQELNSGGLDPGVPICPIIGCILPTKLSELDAALLKGDFNISAYLEGFENNVVGYANDLFALQEAMLALETKYTVKTQAGLTVSKGGVSSLGSFAVNVPAEETFAIYLYNPENNRSTRRIFTSGQPGRRLKTPLYGIGGAGYVPAPIDDLDSDLLDSVAEEALGTSPNNPDTDGDGINDYEEIQQGLDPLDGISAPLGILANLEVGGSCEEISMAREPETQDLFAFLACDSAGMQIVDANDFQNPIELGTFSEGFVVKDVAVDPFLRLAALASNNQGLPIVSYADPMLPEIVRLAPIIASRVEVQNGIAYCAAGKEVISVDLNTAAILQRFTPSGDSPVTDVALAANKLYAMTENNRLHVLDISNLRMNELGATTMTWAGGRIRAGDGLVWCVALRGPRPNGGFAIADVSDPAAPFTLTESDRSNLFPNAAIAPNGSGLALRIGPAGGLNLVEVMDVSDQETNSLVRRYAFTSRVHSGAIASGIGYIANGPAGMSVLNYMPFDVNGQPPSGTMYSTITNGTVVAGSRQFICAEVEDDVQVRQVDFFIDGERVISDLDFPFEFPWSVSPNLVGSQIVLTATAIDTGGNRVDLGPLSYAALPDTSPPALSILLPTNNTAFLAGESVFLELDALDDVGIADVQVFLNGSPINVQRVSLFQYAFQAPEDYSTNRISVITTDRSGNISNMAFSDFSIQKQAVSREATVFNVGPPENPFVSSREVSVFNSGETEKLNTTSREWSIFNSGEPGKINATSREWSIFNLGETEKKKCIFREISIENIAP